MRKVALFVEGQTECIFVRELLLRWFEYNADRIGVVCYSLHGNELNRLSNSFGSRDSENFYEIVNVGNDERVLGYLIDHSRLMCEKGFTLIMGLRDMYCEKYRKACKDRSIHEDMNHHFIRAANDVISSSSYSEHISMHFAIMEVEAWMLALLYPEDTTNPEVSYFCPADELTVRFVGEGRSYKKSESDVESICSRFTKNDYESLINSGKCQSFASFVEVLLPVGGLATKG